MAVHSYTPKKIILTSILSLNKFADYLWNPYGTFPKELIHKIILSIYDSWFPCDPRKKLPSDCLSRWIINIFDHGSIRHCENNGCHTIGRNKSDNFFFCFCCKKTMCNWICKQSGIKTTSLLIYNTFCKKCYSSIIKPFGFKCEICLKKIDVLKDKLYRCLKIYCNKCVCKDCYMDETRIFGFEGCVDCVDLYVSKKMYTHK